MLTEKQRDYYIKNRMDDCKMKVYSICQEGLLPLIRTTLEFDDGETQLLLTLYCAWVHKQTT